MVQFFSFTFILKLKRFHNFSHKILISIVVKSIWLLIMMLWICAMRIIVRVMNTQYKSTYAYIGYARVWTVNKIGHNKQNLTQTPFV